MGSLKCLNSPSDTYYLNTWDRARSILGFLITNNYERRVVHTVQYTTFTRFFSGECFSLSRRRRAGRRRRVGGWPLLLLPALYDVDDHVYKIVWVDDGLAAHSKSLCGPVPLGFKLVGIDVPHQQLVIIQRPLRLLLLGSLSLVSCFSQTFNVHLFRVPRGYQVSHGPPWRFLDILPSFSPLFIIITPRRRRRTCLFDSSYSPLSFMNVAGTLVHTPSRIVSLRFERRNVHRRENWQ